MLTAGRFGVHLHRNVQSWTQVGPEAGARLGELSGSSSTLESSRHSSAEGKAAEQEGPGRGPTAHGFLTQMSPTCPQRPPLGSRSQLREEPTA